MSESTITKEQVRAAIDAEVIDADGHGLYPPEFYAPHFDVRAMGLVDVHRSDGTPKGTIFVNGLPVDKLEAVWNLAFLEYLVADAGLPYPDAMGRGFRAQQAVNSLRAWVNA